MMVEKKSYLNFVAEVIEGKCVYHIWNDKHENLGRVTLAPFETYSAELCDGCTSDVQKLILRIGFELKTLEKVKL